MINAHLISLQHGNAGLGQISSPLQRKLTFKVDFEELFEIFYEQKNKATCILVQSNFKVFRAILHLIFFIPPLPSELKKSTTIA